MLLNSSSVSPGKPTIISQVNETSGIYFDTDNVRKLEYFKNPIVIDLKCE